VYKENLDRQQEELHISHYIDRNLYNLRFLGFRLLKLEVFLTPKWGSTPRA